MTINDAIGATFALIAGILVTKWYMAHRKAIFWQRAAESYLALLEAQRQLVDGVLALNESMLADRIALYQQQEAEFLSKTHTGYVN